MGGGGASYLAAEAAAKLIIQGPDILEGAVEVGDAIIDGVGDNLADAWAAFSNDKEVNRSEKETPEKTLQPAREIKKKKEPEYPNSNHKPEIKANEIRKARLPDTLRELKTMAHGGDVKAQLKLGWAYRRGLEVKKDESVAAYWLKAAALQGNADAQYVLVGLYCKGRGVRGDNSKALEWYKLPANQGNIITEWRISNSKL